MNYYNPNYYMSYPYNAQYPIQASQMPQPTYQTPVSQPQQSLNGKIVDSEDVVRATEVPIGGYGIFPKADLSEIYIKSWNNNGTTSVITFKPIIPEPTPQINSGEITNLLIQKIDTLENKIDMFLSQPTNNIEQQNVTEQVQQPIKRVEVVKKNGF